MMLLPARALGQQHGPNSSRARRPLLRSRPAPSLSLLLEARAGFSSSSSSKGKQGKKGKGSGSGSGSGRAAPASATPVVAAASSPLGALGAPSNGSAGGGASGGPPQQLAGNKEPPTTFGDHRCACSGDSTNGIMPSIDRSTDRSTCIYIYHQPTAAFIPPTTPRKRRAYPLPRKRSAASLPLDVKQTERFVAGRRGQALYLQTYLPSLAEPRAVVFLVHDYADHGGWFLRDLGECVR